MIKYIRKFSSIISPCLFKLFYSKYLLVNPLQSNFTGRVFIEGKESKVIIKNGFRSKGRLNLNVRNGFLTIGENTFFNLGVSINCLHKIEIGSNCLFGENVLIYDHDHNFTSNSLIREQGFSFDEVVIGNNVWIGSGSIILKGAVIEDDSIIAAGSVVKGHVSNKSLFLQKRNKDVIPLTHVF